MNGDIKAEAPRPRPLSGGIWTLFSWLRRDDRSISSESLSSAGSDRTAVSFAFLEPLNYKAATEPIVLPPLSPPTDSYKKRIRDRNFRRQRERNITLHRKYGLFKGENSDRYDAFSLPSDRRNIFNGGDNIERGRRAASESFQRRAPYVPGKRRAPLPPAVTNSLPRNFSRKRPAPQPPNNLITKDSVRLRSEPMNSKTDCDRRSLPNNNISIENNVEKTTKQEKVKSDKSFLKQIFENRKRNSAIETNYVKLLPNISELDKQAAKIIENKKLKLLEGNGNVKISDLDPSSSVLAEEKWMCTKCFKSFNTGVPSCLYCVSNQKTSEKSSKIDVINSNAPFNIYTQTDNGLTDIASTSTQCENDEKKKLKEMLKEMKDSLPKRSKNNTIANESPTLRIGSSQGNKDEPLINSNSSPKSDTKSKGQDKLEIKSVEKNVGLMKVNRTPDILINKSDFIQPSSSAIKFSPKKASPQYDSKNHDSERSDSKNTDLEKSLHIPSTEIKNSSVSNQRFNIPLTNKNVSEIQTHSKNKDDLPMSLFQRKDSVIKTQVEPICNENNLKFQPTFLQKSSSNEVTNLTSVKTENFESYTQHNHSNLNTAVLASPTSVVDGPQTKTKDYFSNVKPEPLQLKAPQSSLFQKLRLNEKTGKTEANTKKNPSPLDTGSILSHQSGTVNSTKEVVNTTKTNADNFKIASTNEGPNLHTPLRISSLLNPVYRPIATTNFSMKNMSTKVNENTKSNAVPLSSAVISQPPTVLLNQRPLMPIKELSEPNEKSLEEKPLQSSSKITNDKYSTNTSVCKVLGVTPSSSKEQQTKTPSKANHHIRRRELVSQLEQSIVKGDEQAAADAAVKLAKLRLSCSVLSFSSQIVGNVLTVPTNTDSSKPKEKEENKALKHGFNEKPMQVKVDNKVVARNISPDKKSHLHSFNKGTEEAGTAVVNIRASTSKDDGRVTKLIEDKMNPTRTVTKTGQSINHQENDIMAIKIWVEDKEATRGPIPFGISRQATLGELRREAEASLGLDSQLQRWIVGRTLCLDDSTPLITLAGRDFRAPFYLCIVESETKKETASPSQNNEGQNKAIDGAGDVYTELMKLEKQAIVPNTDAFECGVCMDECESGRGVVLRECIHTFCRECLSDVVRHCEEPIVSCPAMGCPGVLQEREIRALLSTEEYERWLARGLATAECGTRNAFHCRTRDCTGWALCEPGVRKFPCPVCKCNNCVPCQAIHEGETCEQYQTKIRTAVTVIQTSETDEGTQALLNSLKRRGEALECPECRAIITKKWGCDWVKCSACKTEICWVTRGRRWGPGGRGDTSAGCKCGVDGKRCHPSCGYCH